MTSHCETEAVPDPMTKDQGVAVIIALYVLVGIMALWAMVYLLSTRTSYLSPPRFEVTPQPLQVSNR